MTCNSPDNAHLSTVPVYYLSDLRLISSFASFHVCPLSLSPRTATRVENRIAASAALLYHVSTTEPDTLLSKMDAIKQPPFRSNKDARCTLPQICG